MQIGPFRLGRYQTELEKGLQKDPDAYLDRARALFKEKKFEDAEKLTRIAIDMRSEFPDAVILLGDIYCSTGRKKEGNELKKKTNEMVKIKEKTVKAFVEQVRKQFSDKANEPSFWIAFGLIQVKNNAEFFLIEACYREAIRLNPRHSEGWDFLGFLLLKTKRFREAEMAYRELTKFSGMHPGSWHNLGASLSNQGKHGEALEMLEKSLEIDDTNPAALHDYGLALNKLKRYTDAESALRKSLEFRPDDADTMGVLARVLVKLGRKEEAESIFSEFDDPEDETTPKIKFSIGESVEKVETDELNSDERLIISLLTSRKATSIESAFGPFLIRSPPFIPEILNPLKDKGFIGLTDKGGMYLTDKGLKVIKS